MVEALRDLRAEKDAAIDALKNQAAERDAENAHLKARLERLEQAIEALNLK
jgi:peptidoglycan hydrolase CwlO-like protein